MSLFAGEEDIRILSKEVDLASPFYKGLSVRMELKAPEVSIEVEVTKSLPEQISKTSKTEGFSWSKLKKIVSFESIERVLLLLAILARQ
jgi:hypothetical protein